MIIFVPTGAPLITKESISQSKIIHVSEVEQERIFMVIAVVKRLMNWEFKNGMLQYNNCLDVQNLQNANEANTKSFILRVKSKHGFYLIDQFFAPLFVFTVIEMVMITLKLEELIRHALHLNMIVFLQKLFHPLIMFP